MAVKSQFHRSLWFFCSILLIAVSSISFAYPSGLLLRLGINNVYITTTRNQLINTVEIPEHLYLGNMFGWKVVKMSPTTQEIAFLAREKLQTTSEIYTMKLDGSNLRRVTYNDVDETTLSWSPDGRKITYSTIDLLQDGPSQTFVVEVNKKNSETLIGVGGKVLWSPLGKSIALLTHDLFLLDPKGRNQPIQITHFGFGIEEFRWSPDGEYIAYTLRGHREGENNWNAEDLVKKDGADIYIIRKDGADARKLLDMPDSSQMEIWWSPDGKHIVFWLSVFVNGSPKRARFYVNTDGSGEMQPFLTTDSILDWVAMDALAVDSQHKLSTTWAKLKTE